METCECGFAEGSVAFNDIADRVTAGAAAIVGMVVPAGVQALARPTPQRWSSVEYVAHVRDVLLTVRDRLVIGLVEDNPGFKPMYRDERVTLGLYRLDTVPAVAPELTAAAAMFTRLFTSIDPELLSRPVQYGFPDPSEVSLMWMGTQAVHEVEHHGHDIEENLRRVAAPQ